MTTTLSLIGFGEAGAIFGQDLAALDVKIYAYDRLLEDPAQRTALRVRSQRCGVQLCESAAQAIALGEWVISAVTADNALEVALNAAPLMRRGQLFIDINSVAPSTKRAAATAMQQYGIDYIDAAVMAPVPPPALENPHSFGRRTC